ncbi:MAG: GNAT family N-acetyltransferase [Pseudonocardiaceae bacterium]
MTNTAVTVRPAPPGERDEVRDLLRAAYQEYAADIPPHIHRIYLTDLLDMDRGGPVTTLVALVAGRIVGTARLYGAGSARTTRLPAGSAWVRAVGVLPGLRGAGIARELMAECARLAGQGGASTLGLHTMAFMPAAIRLYERLGYRRAPEWDIDLAARYRLPAGDRFIALAYQIDLPAVELPDSNNPDSNDTAEATR